MRLVKIIFQQMHSVDGNSPRLAAVQCLTTKIILNSASVQPQLMQALEGEFIEFRVYVRRLEDALRSVENPDLL